MQETTNISRRRRRAMRKIYLRHREVEKHVYLHSEVTNEAKTRMYLCIDGVKILAVSDRVSSVGSIPAILHTDAPQVLEYIRHQYYLANRHNLLNPRAV